MSQQSTHNKDWQTTLYVDRDLQVFVFIY